MLLFVSVLFIFAMSPEYSDLAFDHELVVYIELFILANVKLIAAALPIFLLLLMLLCLVAAGVSNRRSHKHLKKTFQG